MASINSVTVNDINSSQLIELKGVTCRFIKIVFVIFLILNLTVLLFNYHIVTSAPLSTWIKSTWNTKTTQNTIHISKKLVSKHRTSNSSKFRCTGDENNIDAFAERLCIFNNICYNVKKNRFEYYRQFRNPKFPLFFDASRGMLTEFSIHRNGRDFLSLTPRGHESWAPYVVDRACPSTDVTWLTNLHTLWRGYFGDDNVGHAVWEDIGSIFYSMQRMNIFDDQLMVMYFGKVPENPSFQKYLDNTLAAITPKKTIEYKSYLSTFNTSYVCFRNFMAGGNMLLLINHVMKEIHGRERLLYNWRSKIIAYHKFDPEYIPNQHRFVITNKSASVFAESRPSKTRRNIANLKEVVTFVRNTYPEIPVEVVEWHKVPFPNQIELLLKTTILITPPGGVSMIAPFLPHGSHAIIMDYYSLDGAFGFPKGGSASMEGMLHNHFPHFKKDYYQVYGPQDYVYDFPGAHNTRDDASIVVNVTRLHLLIESALEEMNL